MTEPSYSFGVGVHSPGKSTFDVSEKAARLIERVQKEAFRDDHEGVSFRCGTRNNRFFFEAVKEKRVFIIYEDYLSQAQDVGRSLEDRVVAEARKKVPIIQSYTAP